jgi:acetylornithine deacetylase/succinyl-diaminopimelate desuccinylase-like protein
MIDSSFASAYFEEHRQAILDDWFALLRLPTVGADPKRLGDCARAAALLKKKLQKMGFEAEIVVPESGLPVPVVFAERQGLEDAPTVLFYGHYDVQPEDPLDGWNTPPFEPVIKDGRVYARGAQDNKGQVCGFLQGVKALLDAGESLPTLKIVLEGQEESGSESLRLLAPQLAKRLRADVLMVSDTSCAADGRPSIVAGLRGVRHFTVTLTGPGYDLHSGIHGGVAPNPAQGMARLLASLHNADGSIAVKGFCDQVREPTGEELDLARQSMISSEDYGRAIGCPPYGGKQGVDHVTRGSFMPTIEINGIHSGYGGPGSKTVIPSSAFAKISMRLVPDQRPDDIMDAVKAHFEQHCPKGLKLEIPEMCAGAPGFRLELKTPVFRLADDVLSRLDPRGAVFRWEGASIPIVSELRQISGAAPLLVGFGQEGDKIHCPNESFGLDQFVRVMAWYSMMLKELAGG